MSKYLSCSQTAGYVRQALKEAFPGIKFSVRSSTYAGGSSVAVRWTDGPNQAQVQTVAKIFSGSYFDSMQDLKGSTYAYFQGEVVRFGADFVFCHRDYSPALIAKACAYVGNLYGMAQVPTVEDYQNGRLYGTYPHDDNRCRSIAHLIGETLAKRSDRLSVAPSKTASKVVYLGNDGHSDMGALRDEVAA